MKGSRPLHRAARASSPIPEQLEGDLQRQVLQYLELQRIEVCRLNAGTARRGQYRIRLAPPGWPDIIGYMPRSGRILAIEMKRPDGTGERRDEQLAFLDRVRSAGGVAILAESLPQVQGAIHREMGRDAQMVDARIRNLRMLMAQNEATRIGWLKRGET